MDCKCFKKRHKAQGALWGLTNLTQLKETKQLQNKVIISLCVRVVGDPPSLVKPVFIDISVGRKILFRFITVGSINVMQIQIFGKSKKVIKQLVNDNPKVKPSEYNRHVYCQLFVRRQQM